MLLAAVLFKLRCVLCCWLKWVWGSWARSSMVVGAGEVCRLRRILRRANSQINSAYTPHTIPSGPEEYKRGTSHCIKITFTQNFTKSKSLPPLSPSAYCPLGLARSPRVSRSPTKSPMTQSVSPTSDERGLSVASLASSGAATSADADLQGTPCGGSEAGLLESSPSASTDLAHIRASWQSLLLKPSAEGDECFVVPTEFVHAILNDHDPTTLVDLMAKVGPIDCASLQNKAAGSLIEGVAVTAISPELFNDLRTHFGIIGEPIVRHMTVLDGDVVLERYPPHFVVHTLSETAPRVQNSFERNRRYSFSLSLSKTFQDLIDAIHDCISRSTKIKLRVWFISSEDSESIPSHISTAYFLNTITDKKLVGPTILSHTLRSQGIGPSRIHLAAETMSKATKQFVLDLALANINSDQYSPEIINSTGGRLGLSNLGNTCYMNSALQCLAHVFEVNSYFVYNMHERELNKVNPLGYKGEIAVAFSSLIHKLFDYLNSAQSFVTPREFKYTIGRYSTMFHGYQQQDSQEFLSWLLDALHEDLNRIYDKPYVEKPELKEEDIDNPEALVELANTCWHQHKQRNDSIIVDLFTGLYQSTLVCPTCSNKSVTFDPFNDVTLPLPTNKKWYHKFTIVDLHSTGARAHILTLDVELTKTSTYDDLKLYLSTFLGVPSGQLLLFEIFRNYFYRNFQDDSTDTKFMPISELIGSDDMIVVYILPHDPATDIVVPIVNIVQDEDQMYNSPDIFGIPLLVALKKDLTSSTLDNLEKMISDTVCILSKSDIKLQEQLADGSEAPQEVPKQDQPNADTLDIPMDDQDIHGDDLKHEDGDKQHEEISGALLSHDNLNTPAFHIKLGMEPSKRIGRFRQARNTETRILAPGGQIVEGRPSLHKLINLAQRVPTKTEANDPNAGTDPEVSITPDSDSSSQAASERGGVINHKVLEGHQVGLLAMLSSATELGSASILDDEDIESVTNGDNVMPLFSSSDGLSVPASSGSYEKDAASQLVQTDGSVEAETATRCPALINYEDVIVVEWEQESYNRYFKEPKLQAWENIPAIPNPILEENKKKLRRQQNSTISLADCLKNFSSPEVLGEQDLWYCPKCKDHRRATKTIQLWSTGDILTIHLKRFQSARHFSDKINMTVDFPIEGLNMSEYVRSNEHSGEALIYDLVAVDNHYGGLGGGHYTAAAKNFKDGKWYYFNDGRVHKLEDPKETITGAAYLLFYRKRTDKPYSGGAQHQHILEEGKHNFESDLEKIHANILQVRLEIDQFDRQIAEVDGDGREGADGNDAEQMADSPDSLMNRPDSPEDLYEEGPMHEKPVPQKKSRSPMTELSLVFEFESQRKQRLISKSLDLQRSLNINAGYSSSVSNLASPTGSSDDDQENEDV